MLFKTGLGQDSHRFLENNEFKKPCIIAGLQFEGAPGFEANSDGDVVYHAICNAISTITGVTILGGIADELYLKQGITDSAVYLEKAMETLGDYKVVHVALSIEAKIPFFKKRYEEIRESVAKVMKLTKDEVGVMATSGEELTDFGMGKGVQCFAIVTVSKRL